MLQIDILKKSWYFKEFHLQKNEVLFNQGEIDNNIYIIIEWEINIEKYTSNKKDETKTLATLYKNDIFWEASLNTNRPKSVKILAKSSTTLLSINATKWINNFSEKYPEEWINLLKYIIHLTNNRLVKSNELITANHKITKEILKIEEINNKNIFSLIDKFEDIINVDYTLFLENNPVLINYSVIKYDSREKWKMNDKVIEITDNKLDLLELKINQTYHYIQKLTIWDKELWYLIFFKNKSNFNDNDKKILATISTGISGLIKEKNIIEEEKNKDYMEW